MVWRESGVAFRLSSVMGTTPLSADAPYNSSRNNPQSQQQQRHQHQQGHPPQIADELRPLPLSERNRPGPARAAFGRTHARAAHVA